MGGGDSWVWERGAGGPDSWVQTQERLGELKSSSEELGAGDRTRTPKGRLWVVRAEELDEWFSEETWCPNPLVPRDKEL